MTTHRIDFMTFWSLVNQILKSRGQPEMLFGEARGYWADSKWEVAA